MQSCIFRNAAMIVARVGGVGFAAAQGKPGKSESQP